MNSRQRQVTGGRALEQRPVEVHCILIYCLQPWKVWKGGQFHDTFTSTNILIH